MAQESKTGKRKSAYMGLGIALGAGLGFSIGQIFMDGNLVLGMGIGVAVGMVLGMITDELGRVPGLAFVGILAGATVGCMLGVVVGLAHGWYLASVRQVIGDTLFGLPYQGGYIGLTALVVAAVGMVAGVRAEVMKDRRVV